MATDKEMERDKIDELLMVEGIEEVFLEKLKSDYNAEECEGGYIYHIEMKQNGIKCAYSDYEMLGIIKNCFVIMKELRTIKDNGFTYEKADRINEKSDLDNMLEIFNEYTSYKNDNIEKCISELGKYTRVSGAYFGIISRPEFIRALNSTIEYYIRKDDSEEDYFSCFYFLVRAAMNMHSCEE